MAASLGSGRGAIGKDRFDFLPFIAVLTCGIGALLLIMMGATAVNLGSVKAEGWVPARNANHPSKSPVLVEWDGSSAVIHQGGKKLSVPWSEASQILVGEGACVAANSDKSASGAQAVSTALSDLFSELEDKRATHYALFAVRPSGFSSFRRFANEFRCRKIDVGYEPIAQDRKVRLLRRVAESNAARGVP
jgi:hypothetical protein